MSRQFNLFGSLEIKTDGNPSEILNSPKGCALVTYLIVTGQTQSREALADLLWEATSTAQALRNLRTLLFRIRSLVPELQITRKAITFLPLPETSVDFLALQSTLSPKPELYEAAELDAVLQLYRGELLASFYLEGAPRFEEWLALERERLRQQVNSAYAWLSQTYLGREQWSKGAALSQRWLTAYPLDEQALRALMHFLASNGEPAAGLQRYELFRQQLWTEMDLEPEPATLSLAARLEELLDEQGQELTWEHVTAPTFPEPGELAEPGPLLPNTILPYTRNPDFTGREDSLLALSSILFSQENVSPPPTAAITGMGGLGKTQLAVEFAYRYGRYFPGGVYWMRFADSQNVPEEVAATGGERGLGLYREVDNLTLTDKIGRVQRAWQEPVPRLLIFDNCESEELLARWRPVSGGCRVLLTSRRAYWARELFVDTLRLAALPRDESVALLRRVAPRVNESVAAKIAQEVGDLPLALYLAGGFFNRYPQIHPNEYLDQLRDQNLLQHPSLEGRAARYSPTGHELNVARTFAVSFDQLDPAQDTDAFALQLQARAACFAPGEPLPISLLRSTILDDETDMLAVLLFEDALIRLNRLGFLKVEGHETVIMHRLLAAFTVERVGGIEDARKAVVNSLISTLNSTLEKNAYLGELRVAPAHVRFITRSALKDVDEPAILLANLWNRHLRDIAEFEEALVQSQQTLSLSEQTLGLLHPMTAESLNSAGTVYLLQGALEQALPFLERALDIREKQQPLDHSDIAQSLNSLGIFHRVTGDFEAARSYLERTLDLWRRAHGPKHPRVAIALNNLGSVLETLGEPEGALAYLQNALSIWQETPGPDHPFTAHALNNIGRILYKMNEFERARPYIEQALAIREKALKADHPSIAETLYNLGVILTKTGGYQEAKRYLKRARLIQENVFGPDSPQTARFLINLGELHEEGGDEENAAELYERALLILREKVPDADPDLQRVRRKQLIASKYQG